MTRPLPGCEPTPGVGLARMNCYRHGGREGAFRLPERGVAAGVFKLLPPGRVTG